MKLGMAMAAPEHRALAPEEGYDPRMRRLLVPAAAALLLALPAQAYNEAVHHFLTRRAFAGREAWLAEPLAAPMPADHDAFRARFWRLASQLPDAALRAEFLARFPTAASLDEWSFKEFLMLDPAAKVHGLEPTPEDLPQPRGALLPLASRWPDDDQRNRKRYQRDAAREIKKGPDGQPLPFDPATLWMGSLSGTSSQGHAHYGLLPPPLSDDTEVLKKDPRHFGIPKEVQVFGVEFAQLYADLALVARQSGLPAGPWLEAAFAGASFHHLEDVANQIHTIQVGIFEFFEAAFLQSKLRDLRTLGGLLGERASLPTLGLRLVSNHHLLLEDLFAKRVAEAEAGRPQAPEVTAAIAALELDDVPFEAPARVAIAAAQAHDKGAVAALMRTLIDQSSLEGPDCYRLIWQISKPSVRDGRGHAYDGAKGDDPEQYIEQDHPRARELLAQFYGLEGKGLRRATTGLRLWQETHEAEAARPGADQVAVERTLRMLLAYHRAAATRRAAYVPSPDGGLPIAWGWPAGALLAVVLVAFGVRRIARRRW